MNKCRRKYASYIAKGGLLFMAGLILCGCATLDKYNRKRFKVEYSPLDYVQFSRTITDSDGKPLSVHLQLDGSGYLECRVGRSSRVGNDFWEDPTGKGGSWHDMRSDRIVISREEMLSVYQKLVDAGVFDKVKRDKNKKTHKLAVLAKMGFEKNLLMTDDPVFLRIFDELLARFY